jgi:hypothetical protein
MGTIGTDATISHHKLVLHIPWRWITFVKEGNELAVVDGTVRGAVCRSSALRLLTRLDVASDFGRKCSCMIFVSDLDTYEGYYCFPSCTALNPATKSSSKSRWSSIPMLNLRRALSTVASLMVLHSTKLSTPPKLVA